MYRIFPIVVLLVFVSFLVVPAVSAAPSWWPLVPCGINPTDDPDSPPLAPSYYQPCGRCQLLQLLHNLISFVFEGLMPILATLFVVIAGFRIITAGGFPGQLAQGKTMLMQTLVGVLVISIAWLMTNTLIRSLAADQNIADRWYQFQCTAPGPTPTATITTSPTRTPTGEELSEADARAQLAAHGITVNANPPQTTLVGIRQSTIDEVIRFKQACNCGVTITGGTEPGHSLRHTQGFKFDMSVTTDNERYIRDNFESLGTTSQGWARFKSLSGVIYTRETNPLHWDVDVTY